MPAAAAARGRRNCMRVASGQRGTGAPARPGPRTTSTSHPDVRQADGLRAERLLGADDKRVPVARDRIAALRIAVVRNPAVHRDARRVGYALVAECGGLLLLNTVWERTDGRILGEMHNWYLATFVRLDNASGGHPALWLLLAVTATAGVAVPSPVRSACAARRGTTRPAEDRPRTHSGQRLTRHPLSETHSSVSVRQAIVEITCAHLPLAARLYVT
jgi:hypothetical protein